MGTDVSWCARDYDEACAAALVASGQTKLMASLLAARGVTADGLEEFFDPSVKRLARAEDLPGVRDAVRVIMPFVRDKRKIVVFGDYDVDGVSASAILVSSLRRLGATAEALIPRRHGEGYGMTPASLARLLEEHPDVALVVTVDNGITSPNEVAQLREKGISVVVTDHHLPGVDLPQPDALVNPRVASCDGCEELCGAGVAFFLASALAKAATAEGLYTGPKFGAPLLVLAGLATVADIMPVRNQNRILVTQALALFTRCAPIGLRELLQRAARTANNLVARDFGFALAPRINAAGRMSDAFQAYELLTSEDREAARALAFKIDAFNVERKTKEQLMDREARGQIDEDDVPAAIVVRGEDWHTGVAGIVASRLLESYYVPVAVVVGNVGSVRAPAGYNVHDALEAASGHLDRFGGHAAAGGFTLKDGAFEAFREAFTKACAAQQAESSDAAALQFDGWIEPRELTIELFNSIKRLEPFGECNPEPVFGLRRVLLRDINVMGQEGRHLSLSFVNRDTPRAIWWGHGDEAEDLRKRSSQPFDLLVTLTSSDFGTELPHPELRVVAMRPSSM